MKSEGHYPPPKYYKLMANLTVILIIAAFFLTFILGLWLLLIGISMDDTSPKIIGIASMVFSLTAGYLVNRHIIRRKWHYYSFREIRSS